MLNVIGTRLHLLKNSNPINLSYTFEALRDAQQTTGTVWPPHWPNFKNLMPQGSQSEVMSLIGWNLKGFCSSKRQRELDDILQEKNIDISELLKQNSRQKRGMRQRID